MARRFAEGTIKKGVYVGVDLAHEPSKSVVFVLQKCTVCYEKPEKIINCWACGGTGKFHKFVSHRCP